MLSDSWIDASLSRLKGKLSIYGNGTRAEAWRDAVGSMDPETFYNSLTRDLPGQTEITIESKGGGSSEMNITCKYGRNTLLEAENHIFRSPSQKEIRFEEWKVGNETNRGNGLGTILFANQIDMMNSLGLGKVTLRAGRADGPVYWARRGARIREDGPYLQDFIKTVDENFDLLRADIKPETCIEIEKILKNPSPYANVQLAHIEDMHGDKKLYTYLLYGANPRCIINMNDDLQMSMVHKSLNNLDVIRKHIRDDFPEIKPVSLNTPQPGQKVPGSSNNSFTFNLKH